MLNKAIKLASKLNDNKYNLVAIITDKKGKILSTGKNSYTKTHPKMALWSKKYGNPYRIYLHAECHAILKLKENDDPYVIYVARTGKNGEPLNSKPCKICMNVIKKVGIKEIFYTKEK